MGELKELFKELLVMLERYGSDSYNPQKRLLKEILYIIDENNIASQTGVKKVGFRKVCRVERTGILKIYRCIDE